ncbi:MAG: hypothetical protein JJU00_07555 [Opitutales bacterium]|nr:hypothetical protein [Opitutales bacterium]
MKTKKAGSLPLSCPPLFSISLLLITPKLPFGKSDDVQHSAPEMPERKRKILFFSDASVRPFSPRTNGVFFEVKAEGTHFYKRKRVRRKNGQVLTQSEKNPGKTHNLS